LEKPEGAECGKAEMDEKAGQVQNPHIRAVEQSGQVEKVRPV
jgi:hypothetical protein